MCFEGLQCKCEFDGKNLSTLEYIDLLLINKIGWNESREEYLSRTEK